MLGSLGFILRTRAPIQQCVKSPWRVAWEEGRADLEDQVGVMAAERLFEGSVIHGTATSAGGAGLSLVRTWEKGLERLK